MTTTIDLNTPSIYAIEVVTPVLHGHMETVSSCVQIGDDRLALPVPVVVDHIAPVALCQQGGVVALVLRPGQGMRPDADLGAVGVVVLNRFFGGAHPTSVRGWS